MPQYLSPGVYVEEIPSAVQAIAGVGTSTAGFIGIVPDVIVIPPGRIYEVRDETVSDLTLKTYPVLTDPKTYSVRVDGVLNATATLVNDFTAQKSVVTFPAAPTGAVTVSYKTASNPVTGENIGIAKNNQTEFRLANYPVQAYPNEANNRSFTIRLKDANDADVPTPAGTKLVNDHRSRVSKVVFPAALADNTRIAGDYIALPTSLVVVREKIGIGNDSQTTFRLANAAVHIHDSMFAIRVGNYDTAAPATGVTLEIVPPATADSKPVAQVTFTTAPTMNQEIWADYVLHPTFRPIATKKAQLCTSFGDFRKNFGAFSADEQHNRLAHAVFGFFHNGGTRCFVARMTSDTELEDLLFNFGAVDEIAIVAAPGLNDAGIRDKVVAHCKVATQDRMAIFDSPFELVNDDLDTLSLSNPTNVLPPFSDYAAFYFPWIQVFDPAKKTMDPTSDGRIFVPPSGHMAGIYARVDTNRGVHKAPANEPVLGALGLRYQISKAQQDGLNPQGVNCIRDLNGSIRIWGARTIGGDANGEWRYINVRRTFLFLRESIDEGTQWAVFEPNDEKLWAKITRNITAFLTTVWRSGALFGSSPDQAFYVKCDAETNPPELREVGQVVTEIGVAVVRPAEFVIFRISQWQPEQ